MEWTTHGLSGIALGFLMTGDWKGAVVGGVSSLIPDIDEPKSKLGRPLLFISYPLKSLVGHRTLTHSLPFALIMSLLVMLFTNLTFGLAVFSGIVAHILGDMITGRVQLLYPHHSFIGIPTSRLNYLLIDRIVRVALTGWLLLVGYQEIQAYM
ncbi:metal-dependent hydrolase [Halobacillus locisalis]|uniref:Metal-dependent hydrolase n=1 Tax=Halobacillus locisalis TaxID=220753 RepID=A0A838CY81_9BACI|nr:metal-dependent hydrolase [Halobacillus locisalis]MBA2176883.1 metal-dependent hydrolase [Halobacillus locisalis]